MGDKIHRPWGGGGEPPTGPEPADSALRTDRPPLDAGDDDALLGDEGPLLEWRCGGCYGETESDEQPAGWKLVPVKRPDGATVWHALCADCRDRDDIRYPSPKTAGEQWTSWAPIRATGEHVRPSLPAAPAVPRASAADTSDPLDDAPTEVWKSRKPTVTGADNDDGVPRCECGAIATRRAVWLLEKKDRLIQWHVAPRCPSCNDLPEISLPTGVNIHFSMEPLPEEQARLAMRALAEALRGL